MKKKRFITALTLTGLISISFLGGQASFASETDSQTSGTNVGVESGGLQLTVANNQNLNPLLTVSLDSNKTNSEKMQGSWDGL